MNFKIGVDAGGTKTECILVDATGAIVDRHLAPGCNPSVVGPDQARVILAEALRTLCQHASARAPNASISDTHIYAAGSRAFWREVAATLKAFGRVFTADDSYPVLELATGGEPGLVLHGGTGSFVAARAPDRSVHYAGGIGWRFGDGGSGYDIGRRAVARALLELQGWATASSLTAVVREHTQLGPTADAPALTRQFYTHPDPNRHIASVAPAILQLAAGGDVVARRTVEESIAELLALAERVAEKLFPGAAPRTIKAGVSGPILTHPGAAATLAKAQFILTPISGAPIEGVRRLLLRTSPV